MSSINRQYKAASIAAILGLAACSGSGTSPAKVTTANLNQNVLQFAVGTANVYGDLGAGGGAFTGLNVAATYRQPTGALNPGASAVLVSSPTLTLPNKVTGTAGTADAFFSTVETGPASTEIGTLAVGATAQAGSSTASTFGTSGGVFGLGIAPFNYSEGGAPDAVAPYINPLYDALSGTTAGDPNAFVPWGGPPAFDPAGDGTGVRDESVPAGTLGVPEGLDAFETLAPAAGTYMLSVAVPANTGTTTQTATATLTPSKVLPAFTLPTPVADGKGGATIPVTLPAGVTEAYIQVTDFGPPQAAAPAPESESSNGSSGGTPTYYTIVAKASGTFTLPDSDGPGPSPSLCTSAQNSVANGTAAAPVTTDGDEFTVQLVGFDYPWYEASYPNSSGNPAPTIVGGAGQTDITISSAAGFTQPAGVAATAGVVRKQFTRANQFTRMRHR